MHSLFAYINSQREELIKLVKELVSIPTVNPPGKNYEKIVKLLDEKCKRIGLKTRRIIVPVSRLKKYKVNANEKRICLLADWNVGASKTLNIGGHYDVVPCTGAWHTDPFKPVIKNGRIYGRGTEDMKGNIACYIAAVYALKKCGLKPKCNLQFSFTPDEEIGGRTGFGYLAEKNLIKADYGINEGYSDNYVSYGNKGVVWLNVEVLGKSAHASKPSKGMNSFDGMVAVAQELMKLNKKISKRHTNHITKEKNDRFATMVLGGQSWGGEKVNIIPDASGFTIDRRFLPEENIETVKKEIFECIKKAEKKIKNFPPGADSPSAKKIKIEVLNQQGAAISNIKNKLADSFSEAICQTLGETARFAIMPGATDIRFLMEKGAPCLGYSVSGGERCHANDEYVKIKSLLDTTKIFAYVFRNFGG